DSDRSWIAFGAAVLLEREEVAEQVANGLTEDSLRSVLIQEMPIFTLISANLYERVRALAISKGFEVPAIEEEYLEADCMTNLSDDIENQEFLEELERASSENTVKSIQDVYPEKLVAEPATNDNDAHLDTETHLAAADIKQNKKPA
ncbi:TPA: hypothetical protein R1156_003462, partial [Yersinia enterocolitica]|nr:hypothetical protein [Yersinia enterocolitica]